MYVLLVCVCVCSSVVALSSPVYRVEDTVVMRLMVRTKVGHLCVVVVTYVHTHCVLYIHTCVRTCPYTRMYMSMLCSLA